MNNKSDFDVVICGAGLAGLCLARQLRLEQPDVSVAVLDPHVAPLPEAAWKVGESTVEFGAHYLADYLKLNDLLQQTQLAKVGLRFFFPSPGPTSDRPELGLSQRAPVLAYQIDRGTLENDLRSLARDDGSALMEGCQVRDIEIGQQDQPHVIVYTDVRSASEDEGRLNCRWVIDATGRRQLIQRKLNLRRPHEGHSCSAAWFRLAGRRDVDDLVPPENEKWHDRVSSGMRYYSTNHLCGRGYWVWLIPLKNDVTSIGIVTRGDIYPLQEYNTYERALDWLAKHEPELARYLGDSAPLDFRAMKDYSYTSHRVFSSDRWACVGEAAVFADPFYSPGTDLIAIANTMTCDLIRRDRAGDHKRERVGRYSNTLIGLNDYLTRTIQDGYGYLGDEMVSLARSIWDYASGWLLQCPQLFNRAFTDDDKQAVLVPAQGISHIVMAERARALFDEWLDQRCQRGGRLSYGFFDYLKVDWLAESRLTNLRKLNDVEELGNQYRANLGLFESLLQALFLLAVDDLHPEEMARLDDVRWMNVQRLTLEPSQWDTCGIFEPRTTPREFRYMYDQIRVWLSPKHPQSGAGARQIAI